MSSEIIGKLIDKGIDVKISPNQQKVKCPQCIDKRSDKRDKSLSVNIGLGVYRCHYCGWSGCVSIDNNESVKYKEFEESKTEKLSDKVVEFMKLRGISRDTLRKMKVSSEDRWISKADAMVDCIVFNYYEKSRIVNKKYRWVDGKGFALEADAKLVFYNIDSIICEDEIIITEGEIDCLSFIECGIDNVISVPNGANRNQNNLKYLDNCIDYFENAKKIYLAVDNDDAGLSLRDELIRRLGRDICWIVKYPDGCKDANEVLLSEGNEGVINLIRNAEQLPLEGVVYADSEMDNIMSLYRAGIQRGEEVKEFGEEFDKLCTFQTGRLYTITGVPSHGKSGFLENIEVILAAKKGWKFGVFSPEHYPLAYMIYKYAELLTGKPFFEGLSTRISVLELKKAVEFIKDHFFFIRPKDEMFTLDAILDISKNLVKRHGVNSIIIDPWNTVNHDFGDDNETKYIEKALNKITLFKQEYDVMFAIVAHPTKMQKNSIGQYEVPNLYDINGSSNFFNKTDIGFTVYRDYNADMTLVYMQKVKYRNLGEVGSSKFKFNKINNRYMPIDGYGQPIFNNKSYIGTNEEQLEFGNNLELDGMSKLSRNVNFDNKVDYDFDDLPF